MNKGKFLARVCWVVFTCIFIIAILLLNRTLDYAKTQDIQKGKAYERAKVIRVISAPLAPDPDFPEISIGIQELELQVLSGPDKGKKIVLKNQVPRLTNYPAGEGTRRVVSSYDHFVSGMVMGYDRTTWLYLLAAFFLILVAVVGRWKGLRSIFGLVFTLICILFLFIPLLLEGMDPIPASVLCVLLSTGVTLCALNGFSAKTLCAGVGCVLCTLLAGLIALGFGALMHVSVYVTPEAENLIFIAQNTALKLSNILFAGIIIASSGAMMDTTMSIASAVAEIRRLDPKISPRQLWKSGMNIGKDVLGTMTNTLILAFAGSSLNVLLIIFMYQMPWLRTINMDLLVIEILKGLAGSAALALSIPITALLSARLMGRGHPSGAGGGPENAGERELRPEKDPNKEAQQRVHRAASPHVSGEHPDYFSFR